MADRRRVDAGDLGATAVGGIAIVLWAALALLTVMAKGLPPFELLSLSFGVAFFTGLMAMAARGRKSVALLRQSAGPWLTAFFGIFLYHALYFLSLATIPPARASLIAYLWPLLIVVFSAFTPAGVRLRLNHIIGALLGLTGAALLFANRHAGETTSGSFLGYAAAFGCAIVWSGYSVRNRRYAAVPSEMLVGVCGGVAVAGAVVHWVFESTARPTSMQWLAVGLLGIGPTGLAFFAWDYATKHGRLPVLGALSYLAPLLSTLLLVITGHTQATANLAVSSLLIAGGALLASLQLTNR